MKEAMYYIQKGYEDNGYVSPELSSTDEYPDYIKAEVKDTIKKIIDKQNSETITFAFMTDLHYATTKNHNIRMKRTINAYKEIAKCVDIDILLLGGDYTNEGCKEYKTECFNELRKLMGNIRFFPVNGNHDDGSIWDKSYIKAKQSINHFTHKELYELFYNHVPGQGAKVNTDNGSLYYYFDELQSKTRFVMLDTGDVPYIFDEHGKLLYGGQHLFALSQNQIDWLVNEALNFNEEGWNIVFVTHSIQRPSDTTANEKELFRHLKVLTELTDAYKRGEKYAFDSDEKYFGLHIDVDFSQYKRGDIIAFLVGDFHTDAVEKSKSGINYILTANAVMYCTSSPSYVQRKDGDKTEILFDVITVNKKTRTIHIVRVGAGEDRIINY